MATGFDVATTLAAMADTTWGRARRMEHDGQTITRLLSDLDLKAPTGRGYAVDGIITHVFPYTQHLVDSCTLELRDECDDGFVIFLRYTFATIHGVFRMHEFLDSDSEQRSTVRRLFSADGLSYEQHLSCDQDKISYHYPAGGMSITRCDKVFWIDVWFRGQISMKSFTSIHDGLFDIGTRRFLIWDYTVQLLPCCGKDEA